MTLENYETTLGSYRSDGNIGHPRMFGSFPRAFSTYVKKKMYWV